jgi:hypothetical protein
VKVKIGAENFSDRTMATLALPVAYFIYFVGLSTAAVMAGNHLSAKFSVAALWVVAALPIACIPLVLHARAISRDRGQEGIDGLFALSAFLVASAAGFIAASINRPDVDDSIYVPKAIAYLENPDQVLDRTITWLAGLSGDPVSVFFYHYEIVQASLAGFFGLHFLDLYHVAFPAIVGFLMCLSMLLLLSIFDRRRWACLFGLVLLMLIILSLGETHRTFGNISIARAFHAKYMFLAMGVPAWIYFSLRFLALKELSSWLVLLAAGIGMAGATTTAMVFLPLLSGLLFLSYVMSEGQPLRRDNAILGLKYISALVPVVLLALEFHSRSQHDVYAGAPINAGFPMTFEGQLGLMIDPQYPLTPVLFVAGLIAVLLYSRHRRFFAWWIFLAIVLFLNPLVSGPIINHLTTENVYWRLFWLLPFPAIVVVGLLPLFGPGLKSAIAGGLLLAACAWCAFWGPTSVIRPENAATFGWPGYKIHEPELSAVEQITAAVPNGSMFAPLEISSNIVLLSARYPQYHLRYDFLQYALQREQADCDLGCRGAIYQYLYGGEIGGEGGRMLETLLSSKTRPDIFVLSENTPEKNNEIDNLFRSHEFRETLRVAGGYRLYEPVRGR